MLADIPQSALIEELSPRLTLDEVNCISRLQSGKSPGADGIPAEIVTFVKCVHSRIGTCWEKKTVPQHWKNGVIVILYLGKGKRFTLHGC